MLKQISIFLENRSGRLYEVTRLLADNNVNIRALSVADTSDFGVVRLIVKNPGQALELLKSNDYSATIADVVAVEVEDRPGDSRIFGIFHDSGINVEYMYSSLDKTSSKAIMIFRFDDNKEVMKKLAARKIKPLEEDELFGK